MTLTRNIGKICRITSTNPITLGKTFQIGLEGVKRTTAANLVAGTVDVLPFNSVSDFVGILQDVGNNQALCASLPLSGDKPTPLVTKSELALNRNSGAITRSKEYFAFPRGQRGVMTLDYDPPSNASPFHREELWALLCKVVPQVEQAGVIWWCSGSSYIYSGNDAIQGIKGQRLYIFVNDISDIERCGDALAKRLWLAGYGHISVSKSGAKLIRSTFDTAMYEPARLDFIGGAVCHPPLEQRRGSPIILSDGGWLDTVAAIPDLSAVEEKRYEGLVSNAKALAEAASNAAREEWLRERLADMATKLAALHIPEDQISDRAERCLRSALGGVLHGDFEIVLDDDTVVSVGGILDNREKYHGRLTKDPLEPDYQNGKIVGKLYLYGAAPNLHSFARGGSTYKLRRQPKRLYVVKGRRPELVDSIILHLSREDDIFVRGGQLVQVVNGGIRPFKKTSLSHTVGSRIALYSKNAKGIDCPVDLGSEASEMILALAEYGEFREIKAFVTMPFVRADGSLVLAPGYDEKTHTYADFQQESIAPLPEAPSSSDIVQALKTLWGPWSKFPFASEHDRAAMLAAIFTAVCRPSLDTAPAFFFDAPVQGTGKSLCAAALGALVRGKRGGVSPFVGGDYADAEMLKQIVSMLLTGSSFWLIDNVVGTWKSAVLSALITDGAVDARILGQNTWVRGEARLLLCATGNNASLDKDLGRRFVKVRIDSGEESPQGRDFDFSPVSRALKDRLQIARSVLLVIRAFSLAGNPALGRGTAGFGAWSSLVRQCVMWCSSKGLTHEAGIGICGDPAISILEDAGADDEDVIALTSLLRGLALLYPNGQTFQAKDVLNIWFKGLPDAAGGMVHVTDGLTFFLHNKKNVSAMTIAKVFRYRRERPAGGLKLVEAGTDRNKTNYWSVVSVS
ncbi:hypothetical protein [Noviherbaspirillum sp. UKPF54]|uniref:hypothetical protein n=1 Tax=Noviherbaspirillum sp. UKPF54 TaxID=2601898 RepID=UPI0011B1927E|nr:hypothetical protein [Noviherbaspirillum sp. UKPF54]QDZ29061.1 hypothetical protein FAY22_14520 [Noviherbaspirillum sp. UKPF54]